MAQFCTIDQSSAGGTILKVVGVGGGGCNALNYMIGRGLADIEYIAFNTDEQALNNNNAGHKIVVGVNSTRGQGAGADPAKGKQACEEDCDKIAESLRGASMVFITAGMGGGTGTGGAPVIASIAKSMDILTVAIVTKPFRWEGKTRMTLAEKGIKELKQHVDCIIIIPNERLLGLIDKNATALQALNKVNEVLYEATRGIADIIKVGGLINVDFADVRSVMKGSGIALMGCGIASGSNRTIEAAQKAIMSPFLEGVNIKGAKNVLVNVTGPFSLTMDEINNGNNVIYDAAGDDANVIFGCVLKEEMKDYVSITVIATGFDDKPGSAIVSKPANNTVPVTKIASASKVVKPIVLKPYDLSDRDREDKEIPTVFRDQRPDFYDVKNESTLIQKPKPLPKFSNDNIRNASLEQTKNDEISRRNIDDENDETAKFLDLILN